MTCVDAFCGAGGMSLGLRNAGFQSIYAFDIDRSA
ncbi:MAG: DNA cytosine methyltransferase, partial [Acidobacteriota bacterium]